MPRKSILFAACALFLALSGSRAQAQTPGMSGIIMDPKGYPLRHVFISWDGLLDTTDVNGVFGPNRIPTGIAAKTTALPVRARLTGRHLRLARPAGMDLRIALLNASGQRSTPVLQSGDAAEVSLDMESLAGRTPSQGLFFLEISSTVGRQVLRLARLGADNWVLSSAEPAAIPAAPGHLSKSAARTTGASRAPMLIQKDGYTPQQVTVPAGGEVGTITLKPDWTSNTADAPFDVGLLYAPSGWQGETSAITVVSVNTDNLRTGDADNKNIKWTYTANSLSTWAGVAWQHPENNWGTAPGRKVTGATKVTVWAKGAVGGEIIDMSSGNSTYLTPPDPGKYKDTYYVQYTATLTTEWQKIELPIPEAADLSSVLIPFIWVVAAPTDKSATTFYIDDIRFE